MNVQNISLHLSELSDTLNMEISDRLEFLDNEFVSAGLSLFLLMYASAAAPKLPSYVTKWFSNVFVRIVILFFVVYMANKNATVALVTSIGLVLLVQFMNKYNIAKMTRRFIGLEGFADQKRVVDSAGDVVSEEGTPFDMKTLDPSRDEANEALREAEMNRRRMEEEALPSQMVNNLQEVEKPLLPTNLSEPEVCMNSNSQHDCQMKVNSRNVPYHQYVDGKPGLHSERDSTGVVKGWDDSPRFFAY